MTQYQILTQTSKVTALVTADGQGLLSYLVESLIDQGIAVEFVNLYESIDFPETASQIQRIATQISAESLVQKRPGDYTYIFHLTDLGPGCVSRTQQLLSMAATSSAKITIVLTEAARTSKKLQRQTELFDNLSRLIKKQSLDVRIICLHDLYGPNLLSSKTSSLGGLLAQLYKPTITLYQEDQSPVFPLHVDDAIPAIQKTTFMRQSTGVIYEAGGEVISHINLVYKLRQVFDGLSGDLKYKSKNYLDKQHLAELITLTQNQLRWRPQTKLEQGLKETLKQLHPEYQQQPPVQKVLNFVEEKPVLSEATSPEIKVVTLGSLMDQPDLPEHPQPLTVVPSVVENHTPSQVTPTMETTSILETVKAKSFSLGESQKPAPRLPKVKLPTKTFTWTRPRWSGLSLPSISSLPTLRVFLGVTIACLLLMIQQLGSVIYHGWRLKQLGQEVQTHLAQGTIGELEQQVPALIHHHQAVTRLFYRYHPVVDIIWGQSGSQELESILYTSAQMAQAGQVLTQSLTQVEAISRYVLAKEPLSVTDQIQRLESNLSEAYHHLSLAEAELKAAENTPVETTSFTGIHNKLQEFVPVFRGYLAQAHHLTQALPDLLGLEGKRVYLVLLQNNMELRPTGGFIGSYATITLDRGRLIDLKVEDVYAADGQLRGYVKPPEPIERYLGEASWFLRDSNWSPNFPTSAETAMWFLEKQMGLRVDGVVGVNLFVIKDLLATLGPVELVDYQETITADNLYERAQYQSEINFFPGSTQKRDYLGQLTRTIYNQISRADQEAMWAISQSLFRSATQKQILISINNPSTQAAFKRLGWSGEMVQPECQLVGGGSCINDYLAIREANVGVNKANYFLNRSLSSRVSVSADKIQHQLSLALENLSQGNVWPGGPYRSYIRIYTSNQAVFESLSIGNKIVPVDQIDVEREFGKISYGFFTEVASGMSSNIQLKYHIPVETKDSVWGYQLYLQKQPGTDADPYHVSLTHAPNLQGVTANLEATVQERTWMSQQPVITDQRFVIEFARQD